ncbi:MAG: polyphenol oxidase family protein [Betaproteobacteria bacterium]
MNLGDHVGDDPACVASNRSALAQALQARPVFMQQVHGSAVVSLSSASSAGLLQADGALTEQAGLACTVLVADCLPILLAHRSLPLVAAVHAGWRGLAGVADVQGQVVGVVEAAVAAMARAAGCAAAQVTGELLAWLGPCIGPQAFEVGAEVRAAFMQADPAAAQHFAARAPGKYLADLPALARARLGAVGALNCYGNDGSAPWCTVSNSAFFSHRRCSSRPGALPGQTGGRMAACIWLR